MNAHSNWVHLNVGGRRFSTTITTLTQTDGNSMLARMFLEDTGNVRWRSTMDETGAYLIDRSPVYFEPILNYLRHGRLILDGSINPEGVLEEAKFYGLLSVVELLEDLIESEQTPRDSSPITRHQMVLTLMATPTSTPLRCQVPPCLLLA